MSTYLEVSMQRDAALARLETTARAFLEALLGWSRQAFRRITTEQALRHHFARRDAFRRDVEHWSRASAGPVTGMQPAAG